MNTTIDPQTLATISAIRWEEALPKEVATAAAAAGILLEEDYEEYVAWLNHITVGQYVGTMLSVAFTTLKSLLEGDGLIEEGVIGPDLTELKDIEMGRILELTAKYADCPPVDAAWRHMLSHLDPKNWAYNVSALERAIAEGLPKEDVAKIYRTACADQMGQSGDLADTVRALSE